MVDHWRQPFPQIKPFRNGMAATSFFFAKQALRTHSKHCTGLRGNIICGRVDSHQQKKRLLLTDRHSVRTQEISQEHPVCPASPQMAPAQWLHPSPLGAIQPACSPPSAPGWSISHPNLRKNTKVSDP